jgi:hypothetical protein
MKCVLTVVFAIALVATSACGGGGYQAPPAGNGYKPSNTPVTTTSPGKKQPTGPNYATEYKKSADAALKAWSDYGADKTAENFAKVGMNLYDAQRYKIMSDRNGHSTSGFHRVTEVSRLFTDWKKTFQGGDWESDPDYKAAKKAYDEVQQAN